MKTRPITGLMITASVLGLAAPALAQEQSGAAAAPSAPQAAAPVENRQDDIVVTAQGRTQRLQDVPISASIATGDSLEKGAITNLESLAARLPNIKISQAPVADFLNIRGVGSSLNIGFEQSVGTFVDGIYRGRSRATRAAMFDVERVEVLKGPQTTFFGNNTIAGALNITSRKPSAVFEADVRTFYAPNTGEYIFSGGVSTPVTDTLAIRVALQKSGMNGYIENSYTNEKGPHLDDMQGRVSLAWQPSSRFQLDARLDVGRMRDRGIFNSEIVGCPPVGFAPGAACQRYIAGYNGAQDDKLDRRTSNGESFLNNDYYEGETTAQIHFDTNDLIFRTGYFHHNNVLVNDTNPVTPTFGSVVGTNHASLAAIGERYDQLSQEIRFQSNSSRFFEYMVGAYFARSTLNVHFVQGFYFSQFGALSGGYFPATAPITFDLIARERSVTLSGFGSGTLHLTNNLRLNLGARYTSVDKHDRRAPFIGTPSVPNGLIGTIVPGPVAGQALLFPVVGADPGNFTHPARQDKKFLPSASVQYDLTPSVMIYGSYAKGFKAGGYSIGTSSSDFAPETVNAFETGLKGNFFDRALMFNIAAFYSKYANLQETATVVTGTTSSKQIVTNAASSISKGVELSASLRVATGFTISADIAYLDSRYKNYPNGPCKLADAVRSKTCVQDLSGVTRAFSPKWSGNISAQYEAPISDSLVARLQGTTYFSSGFFQQSVADPLLSQSGYAKVDAQIAIGRADGRWELAIVGKNLTNKFTASYRQIYNTDLGGSLQALSDPPRSVGLQFSMKY